MAKFVNKYTIETAREFVEENGCKLLSDEYLGMNEKHIFECSCGNEFTTTFAKFKNRNKKQCNTCGRAKANADRTLSIDDVRKYAEQFGCKLISTHYKNYKTPLDFICSCGNKFTMNYANFRNGDFHQCQECTKIAMRTQNCKYTYEKVADILSKNGCELLDEKKTPFINRKHKMNIRCSCGETFTKSLEIMYGTNKFQCNTCSFENAPNSNGELRIKEILEKFNISYKEQFSFADCKHKYPLRFDFALFNDDSLIGLIEYDGIQHFKSYDYYGGSKNFQIIQTRDNIKNEYCKNNNINLLRIPYYKYDNIEKILGSYFDGMIIPSQAC